MLAVGIDLGTTNSLIAVMKGDKPVLIPNAQGNTLTPSVVGFDDDGTLLVGETAKHRLVTHPHMTASRFKRYMGTDHVFDLHFKASRAEELSAIILKSLKADAEEHLEEKISEAVISVPAYFDDHQRKATIIAAEIAGLKVSRLINEPTAAAIAHGVHNQDEEGSFIVLDLGGGTFDVSILEMFDGVMEVRASAGDAFLGGEDFTDALARDFAFQLGMTWGELDQKAKADIRDAAEKAKRRLAREHDATVLLPFQDAKQKLQVNRKRFEEICNPVLQKIRRPIERSMYDTRMKVEELDKLILVGGATRMNAFKSLASRLFQRLPEQGVDPDCVVALGAAVQAGLNAKHKALDDIVMTDVNPFTLGVETAVMTGQHYEKGLFSPIIERNTVVPVSKVEEFCTIVDKQSSILFKIYQGEAPLVRDNVYLGEIKIPVPKKPAGEELVFVRFTYDPSGILEVDVTVHSTGLEKKLLIEKAPGKMSPQQIAKTIKKLAKLKIHPRDQEKNRTLQARLSKVYEMSLGDDRKLIGDLIQAFHICLAGQDVAEITKMHKEISNLLDEIEGRYVF